MVQYIVLGIEWICRGAARGVQVMFEAMQTHRTRQMMREIARSRAAAKKW